MVSFIKDVIKELDNEYASIVDDGITAGDVSGYIDTGSYIFNALLSGSIYGGMPSNKITAIAGKTATGKTYFALGCVKAFLDSDKNAECIYFESESAISKQMMKERGIDTKRVGVIPVTTIQEFRTQAVQILDKYMKDGETRPLYMVLDSLGMLSTTKEVTDVTEGNETRDMTRSQLIKGAFRVLTLMLSKANIPLLVTNHTYESQEKYSREVMSGGSGIQYGASTIIFLSKRKEKVDGDVIGNVIHCRLSKSRLTQENSVVDVLLTYEKGLAPYYGLIDIACKYGIFKKLSTRIELPDGSKTFGKTINNNPEKYFTQEILDKIEAVVKKEFLYGSYSIEHDESECKK